MGRKETIKRPAVRWTNLPIALSKQRKVSTVTVTPMKKVTGTIAWYLPMSIKNPGSVRNPDNLGLHGLKKKTASTSMSTDIQTIYHGSESRINLTQEVGGGYVKWCSRCLTHLETHPIFLFFFKKIWRR